MQVDTQNYIDGIHQGVDWTIKQNKVSSYPSYLDLIDKPTTLQIDYSKFGGIKRYTLAKNIYWYKENSRSLRYSVPNSKIAEIWGIHEEEVNKLLNEFKEELHTKLDIPKKYDIYR